MAHDDRDRYLDKALARHFRPPAPKSEPASAGAAGEACPDAEVLAAYHDGSLSPEERNFWKQHVLACQDCDLVLAHLGTPLDIPVAAETPDLVVAAVASARPRKTYFRWLVPAGAIAAGLLTFVVIRETQNGTKPGNARVETAENRTVQPPPSPMPSPESPAAENKKALAAAPPASVPHLKDQKAGEGATATSRERDEEKAKSQAAPAAVDGAVAGAAGQPTVAAKEDAGETQLTRQSSNGRADRNANGPEISAQQQQRQQAMHAAGDAAGRASAPAPPPEPRAAFLSNDNVAPHAPQKIAPKPAPQPPSASADAVSATSETVEAASAGALAKVRTAAAPSPRTFGAPGGKILWRVGPGGTIEQSSDAGGSWTLQTSGVTFDLGGGSAPTLQVCWVIGNSGTILRTVDGGDHWVKIGSPVANDLIAVHATDAFHVSVWFIGDPRTGQLQGYQTSDGGANWTPIPSN